MPSHFLYLSHTNVSFLSLALSAARENKMEENVRGIRKDQHISNREVLKMVDSATKQKPLFFTVFWLGCIKIMCLKREGYADRYMETEDLHVEEFQSPLIEHLEP